MVKSAMFNKGNRLRIIIISILILISLLIGFFIVDVGILLPIAFIALSCYIAIQISFNLEPKMIVWVIIFYIFTYGIISREVGGIPYGTLQEGLLLIGWLTIIFTAHKYEWFRLNNSVVYLLGAWLFISIVEVINPAGASVQGWLQEIRAAALYPFLFVPLVFLLMKTMKDLNVFLCLILGLSLFASLNGIKQLYVGLSPGEQRFLDEGAYMTHLLYGKLRVFSFYSDAGQFGASQAHLCMVCLVLALGPFKTWKRIVLLIGGMIMGYGMLISGTRGALFALLIGMVVAIFLSKQFKVIIFGGLVAFSLIFFLKYTNIANGNYQIRRLRSAVDPKEASMNLRFMNQEKIAAYLKTRPFGGGLGVIGVWGGIYNQDKYLASIQPDSYWVKVWAMYGIVGFIIWFGIMMYILGRCCGIVWNIKDKGLKVKAMALTSGYAGILFCSYANEVINTAPSSYIVYGSWVFVLLCPKLDAELSARNKELKDKN